VLNPDNFLILEMLKSLLVEKPQLKIISFHKHKHPHTEKWISKLIRQTFRFKSDMQPLIGGSHEILFKVHKHVS